MFIRRLGTSGGTNKSLKRNGTARKSHELSLLDDPKKVIHQAAKWKERKDEIEELKKIFV